MNNYDKDYDAFDIFEEIKEEECVLQGSGEKIPPRTADGENDTGIMEENWFTQRGMREQEGDFRRGEKNNRFTDSLDNGMYYEIEYDSCPLPGVGKFVLKPQKVETPVRDEVRELFDAMREIARDKRSYSLHHSKFYDKRVQTENSRIFYEQGMFMKDFEDHYTKQVPYSTYFPYYQMMGYEQLRTYFTWRTEVRKGIVENTSLSYAYLYLYELLSNIGVESPKEGLEKLLFFWKKYRVYDASIDKYVRRWLKDYHIYYELPHSFQEFLEKNDLVMYYPKQTEPKDNFELFCAMSKYDIRKSKFYMPEQEKLIKDCFVYLMERVQAVFEANSICFEDSIFQPVRNMTVWTPFKDALFYPWKEQRDRRVVFSEKEVYVCEQNRWTFQTTLTTDSGKRLLGYLMKQMEVVLRRLTKYKYPLTADISMVNDVVLARLKYLNISLEQVITQAVQEYYREATKIVVKVDMTSLEKIRQEALETQDKLIVPEEMGECGIPVVGEKALHGEEFWQSSSHVSKRNEALNNETLAQKEGFNRDAISGDGMQGLLLLQQQEQQKAYGQQKETFSDNSTMLRNNTDQIDEWQELRNTLSEVQLEALHILLNGGSLKPHADAHGIMLEVLIDSINEAAMDIIGDSLLEDEFTIYEDYIEQVKGMVEGK